MKLKIYDFCDTLVKGQTSHNFVYFVLNSIKRTIIQDFILFFSKFIILDYINFKKKILLFSLRGISRSDLNKFAKSYSNTLKFNPKIKRLYLNSLNSKDQVIIASGGYSIYIRPFINNKNVKIIANNFKFDKNNNFTGFLNSKDCLGKTKASKLIKYTNKIKNSYFYSDSLTDLPSFKLVKYPYFYKNNKLTKV